MTVTKGGEEDIRRSTRMSLTYSDFPYYLHNQGDQTTELILGALPREFNVIQESSVPLLQNADESYQDFIILAEFSELEGPIPLCTIPTNAPDKTDIDLNNFAVHLMSTDYQVNVVGHFKICEDTQVLRKNVFKDIHVFMQYFTLYDIKARGFVRPFCFGYVSKDHVKLDKRLDFLIAEFDKMTRVLKHSNRKWFAGELEQYLSKLSKAKESFIQELGPKGQVKEDEGQDGIFFFESQSDDSSDDPDVITLDQIAHQFSEIENILRTVRASESPPLDLELLKMSSFLTSHPNSELVSTLEKLHIGYLPNAQQESIDSLNIPLVHPLKVKGESLRPLTTLGQLGSVHLVWKLLSVYKQNQPDLIFSEMTELTNEFRKHCEQLRNNNNSSNNNIRQSPLETSTVREDPTGTGAAELQSMSGVANGSKEDQSFEKCSELILDPELYVVLGKVHASTPIASDNKSGSYHTVSEEDSDVNIPSPERPENTHETGSNGYVYVSAPGSVESNPLPASASGHNFSDISPRSTQSANNKDLLKKSPHESTGGKSGSTSTTALSRFSLSSMTSMSSEDEIASKLNLSPNGSNGTTTLPESTEEVILSTSWFDYASKQLVRGQPGYGILNFFRHYHKVAHHILYSILMGRPIIVCGSEDQRAKVARIVTSLIPFVPSYPEKSWKLVKWHMGILVPKHLQEYKLIGLCVPERLQFHDMINARDQNYVTILNVPKKSIMGPAYSGVFLDGFEGLCQKHFYNSDVSMICYIGGILTEIETKVYMYKAIQEKNGVTKKRFNFKDIGLISSDIEIVRYLGGLVSSPDDCVGIF